MKLMMSVRIESGDQCECLHQCHAWYFCAGKSSGVGQLRQHVKRLRVVRTRPDSQEIRRRRCHHHRRGPRLRLAYRHRPWAHHRDAPVEEHLSAPTTIATTQWSALSDRHHHGHYSMASVNRQRMLDDLLH